MALVNRMSTKADEPALIQFWSEHGGWDQVTTDTWAHRLLQPPLGPAAIVVANDPDTGEIRGQFTFIPSMIVADGREVSAVRPFAPILHKDLRTNVLAALLNPSSHPVLSMYQYGVEEMRRRETGVLYMVPDPKWVRLLRFFPRFAHGKYPLFSRPLPLGELVPLGEGFSAGPCEDSGERVDRLWAKSSRLHSCQVVRDSRSLPWKVGSGDHEITGVERGGELVGLVASRHKGDRQWLICDLLAADAGPCLQATLAAVCNLAHERAVAAPADNPIRKVALLTTPLLEPVVCQLGFARDQYDFHVLIEVLNPVVEKAEVAPGRWYFSAND